MGTFKFHVLSDFLACFRKLVNIVLKTYKVSYSFECFKKFPWNYLEKNTLCESVTFSKFRCEVSINWNMSMENSWNFHGYFFLVLKSHFLGDLWTEIPYIGDLWTKNPGPTRGFANPRLGWTRGFANPRVEPTRGFANPRLEPRVDLGFFRSPRISSLE